MGRWGARRVPLTSSASEPMISPGTYHVLRLFYAAPAWNPDGREYLQGEKLISKHPTLDPAIAAYQCELEARGRRGPAETQPPAACVEWARTAGASARATPRG